MNCGEPGDVDVETSGAKLHRLKKKRKTSTAKATGQADFCPLQAYPHIAGLERRRRKAQRKVQTSPGGSLNYIESSGRGTIEKKKSLPEGISKKQ